MKEAEPNAPVVWFAAVSSKLSGSGGRWGRTGGVHVADHVAASHVVRLAVVDLDRVADTVPDTDGFTVPDTDGFTVPDTDGFTVPDTDGAALASPG